MTGSCDAIMASLGAALGAPVAGALVAAPLPHAANTTVAAAVRAMDRNFTLFSPVTGRPSVHAIADQPLKVATGGVAIDRCSGRAATRMSRTGEGLRRDRCRRVAAPVDQLAGVVSRECRRDHEDQRDDEAGGDARARALPRLGRQPAPAPRRRGRGRRGHGRRRGRTIHAPRPGRRPADGRGRTRCRRAGPARAHGRSGSWTSVAATSAGILARQARSERRPYTPRVTARLPADSIDAGLAASLRGLDGDGRLLFLTRVLRMFAYGFLAVILVLYLAALGFDGFTIGLILTLTLVGDTLVSLWLTTNADRIGRRRVLVAGSLLMAAAGAVFAITSWVPLLIVAATIGVISPTGNEVGPFLAVEQAALSQATPDARRTPTFAWYNLAGYVATATGALAAGFGSQALLAAGIRCGRRLPDDRHRLCRGRDRDGGRLPPGGCAGRGAERAGRRRDRPAPGPGSAVARDRRPAVGPVRPGCVRRRVHPAEPDGLLVPPPVRRGAGRPRLDLLRGEPPGRGLVAVGVAVRGPVRADQHDGLHPPAVERAPPARSR